MGGWVGGWVGRWVGGWVGDFGVAAATEKAVNTCFCSTSHRRRLFLATAIPRLQPHSAPAPAATAHNPVLDLADILITEGGADVNAQDR